MSEARWSDQDRVQEAMSSRSVYQRNVQIIQHTSNFPVWRNAGEPPALPAPTWSRLGTVGSWDGSSACAGILTAVEEASEYDVRFECSLCDTVSRRSLSPAAWRSLRFRRGGVVSTTRASMTSTLFDGADVCDVLAAGL